MLVEGLIIILDLDKFGEFVEERGLDPYIPNEITGYLTEAALDFVRKWRGVVIYGLDSSRGTEEAVIEIPGFTDIEGIIRDLERIRDDVNSLGASISIVVLKDMVLAKPANSRREAYSLTPGRRRAWKLLKSIKKRGGNRILVLI
ncbi:MAG: hypothetical protein QXP72_02535 [Desulfurococcaceae archaeon]